MSAPFVPGPPRPGHVLDGRYRLDEAIGSGGMAEVFRATDLQLDRAVALKIFRADASDPTTVARQHSEVRTLAALNHPGLVTVYDARIGRSDAGPSYLVMELVDGMTLSQRLTAGPMSAAEAARLGVSLAEALAFIHAGGLVHRDVKPANVLLKADGTAKLSDFGIARLIGADRMTRTNMVLGTAAYLSPEQARGAEVSTASDIYSLGLVLLESLTGRREFPGTAVESSVARLTRNPGVPAGMPEPWTPLLRSMTATDPAARPTAPEVAHSLATGTHTQVLAPGGPMPAPGGQAGATTVLPAAAAVPPPARTGGAQDTVIMAALPGADATGRRAAAAPVPVPAGSGRSGRGGRAALVALVAALVIIAAVLVVILVHRSNSGPATPTPSSSTRTTAPATTAPTTTAPTTTAPTTTAPTTTAPTTTAPTTTAPTTTAPTTTAPTTTAPTTTAPTTTAASG